AFSIDNGSTFQSSNVFSGLCSGGYPIVMEDAAGCHGAGIAQVDSPAPVSAGFVFVPETLFVDQTTAQFTNTSGSNAVTFAWDFDGLGSSVDENPAFAFPLNEPATYTICLAASDSSGC